MAGGKRRSAHRLVLAVSLGMVSWSWGTFAAAAEWRCDAAARRLVYADAVVDGQQQGIRSGDFDKLKRHFADCTRHTAAGARMAVTIDLVSGGGDVAEALAMSDFLVNQARSVEITTRVPRGGYCISACTFLLLAGATREVEAGASFEPHGFSSFVGDGGFAALRRVELPASLTPEAVKQLIQVLNMPRVRMMSMLFGAEAAVQQRRPEFANDPSWGWLHDLFGPPVSKTAAELARQGQMPPGTPTAKVMDRVFWAMLLIDGTRRLSPAQWATLVRIERALEVTLPELERDAVMTFYLGRDSSEDDRRAFVDRHARRVMSSLERAQDAAGITRPSTPAARHSLLAAAAPQVEEIRSSRVEVFQKALLPYLKRRAERDIELDPFVRLMFSTSILYTRGLTREELCDFNIVNIGSCELLR